MTTLLPLAEIATMKSMHDYMQFVPTATVDIGHKTWPARRQNEEDVSLKIMLKKIWISECLSC